MFLIFYFSINTTRAQETPGMPPEVKAGKGDELQFPKASQYANSKLTYKIIPAANKTFCYDILADGRLMIHQPSAPGLPGNEGFKTKKDAEKVAGLVIEKIRKGEMPPSITREEMQKLDVL